MNGLWEWLGDSEPAFYNGRTVLLVIVFIFLAYLVSPLNPMEREERRSLLAVYPAIILVYWLMFQARLLSLVPHVSFGLGANGVRASMTNSLLCFGFGAIFSAAIFWGPGLGRRAYGALFLLLFIAAIIGRLATAPLIVITH